MKSRTHKLIFILIFLSMQQYGFAQQKGVVDLVEQYKTLLHPPSNEAKNSLTYTQHYLDLRKKLAVLGPDSRTAFENSIAQFSSDTGYNELHALLFSQNASDTAQTQSASSSAGAGASAAAKPAAMDSSIQMQVYDRKHKLLQTLHVKPADLESKMQKDGYKISVASYDLNTHTVTLTFVQAATSGNTAKITLPSTGDFDAKYKLSDIQSLAVHSTADGTSSVKVTSTKKTGGQKKK